MLNLVNTIQTEPFKLGPSNLVHILLMTRGRHLLIFKVMGQRSRSCSTLLLSFCLSVCPSVHKACRLDTDWTVQARTVKLGTLTTYDKRKNPIDFQGQGSKIKVTCYTLMLNLVNTIQTESFKLGQSNLVHLLLMTRGRTLLIFKVRGQRSRSHVTH